MSNHSEAFFDLMERIQNGSLSRRDAVKRAAAIGLSGSALVALGGFAPASFAQEQSPVASPAVDPNAKPGGTLRFGLSADPAELDPGKTQLTAAWHVIEHVYNTLVATSPSLEPISSLAESWEISEDGLTYTFTTRSGVTFHNGRAFVADDVKYTYERIKDPATASPSSADLDNVETMAIR